MNNTRYLIIKAVLWTSLLVPAVANAGNYYNCSNATGCKLVKKKHGFSRYTKTKYPVVLAHGMGGWNRMLGLVDYFHGIPQTLIKGGSDVFTTKVSALNTTEYRGEQLLQQVKTIAAITGKQKINLVGHSHGGIDIRYVAAVAPEYVASVTAVASPEQGSKMAEWVVKKIKDGSVDANLSNGEFTPSAKIALAGLALLGQTIDVSSGAKLKDLQKQDAWAGISSLTEPYVSEFNAKYPAAMPTEYCGQTPANHKIHGIPYYSFSGVGQITNILDPLDYVMKLTSLTFNDDPNDGLVSACSSHLGYVIRDDYRMNHADSINQTLGLVSWRETNAKTVYRTQINRLKKLEGL